jgi:hypothetical protein
MNLIPHRFLVRVVYPCRYVARIPKDDEEDLLELPESCRIDNFATLDDCKNFGDVRLAWNESGLGLSVQVAGKEQALVGDASRHRASDGVNLWIDTRDARANHRASRYCHHFYLLPVGAGADHDEPFLGQAKINRAMQDAPQAPINAIPFSSALTKGGYRVEVFLPAQALYGFDPEQHPRLGFYYSIRDAELGEQVLSVGSDFPYWEDPSLWSVLELVR